MKKMLLALMLMSALSAQADVVDIVNGNFEAQPQTEGGYTNNSITGWLGSSASSFSYGVFNPTNTYITGTSAPNANNIAYINSGSISQTLNELVVLDTVYTLNLDVISRLDFPTPGWGVELLVGNDIVGGSYGFPAMGLVDDSYNVTVGYWGEAIHVGQALTIRLSTSGVQTNFDNLTMSAVAAVPEPETYAMMLAGLGLLGFSARRRNKV